MQTHNNKTKEWVNIRISPSVKQAIALVKVRKGYLTYDQVLREAFYNVLISLEQKEDK
jgi:hypothetical protein